MSRLEKFLKTIWAINGVVFLVFVWFSIYPHIHAMFRPRPKPRRPGLIVGEKLEKAKEKGLRLQAIKIERPKLIESVDYWVLPFSQRDLDRPQASQVRLPYWANLYAASYGPFNNLFFYKYDGSDAHLLFDRKLLIAMFAFPTTEKGRFILLSGCGGGHE